MDQSERLSLLALIVAVVALIISGWQLAQQLFATATDGKRYCQGSVIGIWSRKTRLSWRWSQIRFETKYTAPEIRLTSGVSARELATHENRKMGSERLMYKIWGISWLTEAANGPPTDWNRYFEITSNDKYLPLELRKTRRPDLDVVPITGAEFWALWVIRLWSESYREGSPDVVSWPTFLRRIYGNQIISVRKVQFNYANRMNGKVEGKQLETGQNEPDEEAPYAPMRPDERESGEDRVVVRLVECSWDLIPSDVVRPMAKSTVGTMIVIAHRLGMSWLGDFSPSDGKMNASGCGHTLTSEAIRSLGLVVQYTFHEESKKPRTTGIARRKIHPVDYFAPTQAADKLHCGILPIDSSAVPSWASEEDIDLIDASKQVDLATLIIRIGVSWPEYEALRDNKHKTPNWGAPKRAFKHGIEDAVSILCPIVPLSNSNTRWVMWPWRNLRQPFTPFRQRLGLEVLKQGLANYMDRVTAGARHMRNRENSVLSPLKQSPLEYLEELCGASKYLQDNRDVLESERPPLDLLAEAQKIYERIATIHAETSDVFANVPPPEDANADEVRPFIFDLVGAHVTMATKHGKAADDFARKDDTQNDAVETKRADLNSGLRFVKEIARRYIDDLEGGFGGERTIFKHLYHKGYRHLNRGEIKGLWWTLVVRSVCWWLTIRVKIPETQIPSYWYNSQTPVYIT